MVLGADPGDSHAVERFCGQRSAKSAEERLLSLQRFGIKLGLEQISSLLDRLGNPHKSLRFIHVAGTNGKGSVCAILAKALEAAGFKTGFYSSPHLVSLRERVRMDSRGIPPAELTRLTDVIWPHVESMKAEGRCPTFFEVMTALAIQCYAETKCDIVVWETGLGGRYDATNVVAPLASVITGIGLDHQRHLGDTIEKIAAEKAGIIKPCAPVFLGVMDEMARMVIAAAAEERQSPCHSSIELSFNEDPHAPLAEGRFFTYDGTPYRFPLLGPHQQANLSLAVTVLAHLANALGFRLAAALRGVEHVQWPGRFQLLPDGSILDGAHNPQGVESLAASLRHYFPTRKFAIVFASLEDKNPREELRLLMPLASLLILTQIRRPPRGCFSPKELSDIAVELDPAVRHVAAEDISAALKAVKDSKLTGVIAGSLFLAGETLMEYFDPEDIINLELS